MKQKSVMVFIVLMFSIACGPGILASTSNDTTPVSKKATATPALVLTKIDLPAAHGVSGPWFELYFTDPKSPLAAQLTGGPDGPLAAAIDAARLSVDVAIYSLSLNSVRDALLRAHDRGVRVRVVMESDNLDRADAQRLIDAGIPVLGDRREGLMHNKFVVIDNSEVWTGSMNLTDSGAYEDNNEIMRIRSVKLAEDYVTEFEEMFIDDAFGETIMPATPNRRVTIDGTPIDVYFSPDDQVQSNFLDLVNNAQESIYFMAFSFTADPIGEAVRTRAQDDLIVSGVMDNDQINSNVGTEFDPFKQAGLDVLRDGNPGQMHHKVMIIDESIVIFGSYNFTNNAESRNDENMLVIYNEEIAAQFMQEFQRVYAEAQ
jgi:phosphatidylserine/phosphatidylglycerophosphate/cardiolipin synthase-like enzyme